MSQLVFYEYKDEIIEFEVSPDTLMVNATAMAKIFGKETSHFLQNKETKLFIKECLKTRNSSFLGIEKVEDLYTSKQKSGTWMHRILAYEFAGWLDPAFKLWTWLTIDKIIFGQYYELRDHLTASARRKERIENLEAALSEDERYLELEELKKKERSSARKRSKVIRNQTDLFRQQL